MPVTRSPAQQAASRANGARSHGPTTEAGKARSARNGTKHGLRGGQFALLPSEDREEFATLHAAVTADWSPRDAYERRWVRKLVASLWRQDRLRGMELATLAAAAADGPPSDATMTKLLTFARYGARIDKDIGRALYALRVLRDRPDDRIDALRDGTADPARPKRRREIARMSLPRARPNLSAGGRTTKNAQSNSPRARSNPSRRTSMPKPARPNPTFPR